MTASHSSSWIRTKEEAESFLNSYDSFLFDCDGVLWQGTHLLPHVAETLELLRSKGKRLIFVTNNSSKSRQQYTKKFEGFGITVTKEEVFGSAYSAAVYLQKVMKLPKDKKVFVIGETGIEQELTESGVAFIGGSQPEFAIKTTEEELAKIQRDESIGAVLCGMDRQISYYKVAYGMIQLSDPNCVFLATNTDSTFPTGGRLLPGAGTVVGMLETCTGRKPISLGKPSQTMMDCIKARFEFDPARACMVGDRLNTDMVFGQQGGLGTLFVLTGVDKESDLGEKAVAQPKFIASKLGDLFELLQ